MSDEFRHIFDDARRESLTDSERALMRNTLLSHMAGHPAVAPLHIRAQDSLANFANAFGSQSMTSMRFVPATLAITLVVGLGTAYAAEDALPGDLLYPIKVSVSEPVRGSLAVSESAKASWQTERLERRLAEAEVLVAQGKLTPEAQATIETHIQRTVEDFEKNIEALAHAAGEAEVAAAQSDLEASLIGHAEVLVALTASPKADANVRPFLTSVLERAEKAQVARAKVEATVASKNDNEKIRKAALEKKEQALSAIVQVRAKASAAMDAATTTSTAAQESANIAEQTVNYADVKLKAGAYGEAFTTFQEAIREIKMVEVHIDASERLKADVHVFTRTQSDSAGATMLMSAPTSSDEDQQSK